MNRESSERHGSEREDTEGVSGRDDEPEQCCVARRSALPDEVRGDDRLAVSGRQRMRHAPEERRTEGCDDHPEAEPVTADQCREAGVGDAVGRLQRRAVRQRADGVRVPSPGRDVRRTSRDVERAREKVLRVRAQLVGCGCARLRRRRSPSSRCGPRSSCRGSRSALGAVERRPAQDRSRAASSCSPPAPGGCASAVSTGTSGARRAVHRQVRAAREATARTTCASMLARLEGGDLGEVEDVANVDAVARDLDPAETVDREVAERMRRRRRRRTSSRERGDRGATRRFTRRTSFATGAHSSEKCGFRASARRNQVLRIAERGRGSARSCRGGRT